MPTHQALREALAYSLDDLSVNTASSGTSSTVVSASLINGLSIASTNRFDGAYVFNATKRLQRRAQNGSYLRASGTVTVDPTWTSPSANDRIEFSWLFPAIGSDVDNPLLADTSYQSILNEAHRLLMTPRRLALPIVPDAYSYSLATYAAWLDREERFGWPQTPLPSGEPRPPLRLLEPGPFAGSAPIPADWRRPRLNLNADTPTLELEIPFAAGTSGSLYLQTMCPADRWIAVSGVWAETVNDGLLNESDESRPSLQETVTVARLVAIDYLAARGVTSASGRWADQLPAAWAKASAIRYFDASLWRGNEPPQLARAG